jgi:thiamine pyrophosphokinase
LHGPCAGIDVTGARWPLADAALNPWSTLGVSNETTGLLYIAVTDGILTVVVP